MSMFLVVSHLLLVLIGLYGVLRVFGLCLRMGVDVLFSLLAGVNVMSVGFSSWSFLLRVNLIGLVGVSTIISLELSGSGDLGGDVYDVMLYD